MVAFGKNKTVEEEFLCALSSATEGLAVVTRLGATWKGGIVMVCQESGHLEPPWWVLRHKGPCVQPCCTRRAQPSPQQLWWQPEHSLQSWVAAHC